MGGTLILEYLSGMGWVACEKNNILKKYKNIFQSSQIFFMSRCLNVNPKILTTSGQFLLLKSSEHGTESKLCKLCKIMEGMLSLSASTTPYHRQKGLYFAHHYYCYLAGVFPATARPFIG